MIVLYENLKRKTRFRKKMSDIVDPIDKQNNIAKMSEVSKTSDLNISKSTSQVSLKVSAMTAFLTKSRLSVLRPSNIRQAFANRNVRRYSETVVPEAVPWMSSRLDNLDSHRLILDFSEVKEDQESGIVTERVCYCYYVLTGRQISIGIMWTFGQIMSNIVS